MKIKNGKNKKDIQHQKTCTIKNNTNMKKKQNANMKYENTSLKNNIK